METGSLQETDEGWGDTGSEEFARLQSLLELVRRENQRTELSPERREQLRERVLQRWEQYEARRRKARVLFAIGSALVLTSVVLTLAIRARSV